MQGLQQKQETADSTCSLQAVRRDILQPNTQSTVKNANHCQLLGFLCVSVRIQGTPSPCCIQIKRALSRVHLTRVQYCYTKEVLRCTFIVQFHLRRCGLTVLQFCCFSVILYYSIFLLMPSDTLLVPLYIIIIYVYVRLSHIMKNNYLFTVLLTYLLTYLLQEDFVPLHPMLSLIYLALQFTLLLVQFFDATFTASAQCVVNEVKKRMQVPPREAHSSVVSGGQES